MTDKKADASKLNKLLAALAVVVVVGAVVLTFAIVKLARGNAAAKAAASTTRYETTTQPGTLSETPAPAPSASVFDSVAVPVVGPSDELSVPDVSYPTGPSLSSPPLSLPATQTETVTEVTVPVAEPSSTPAAEPSVPGATSRPEETTLPPEVQKYTKLEKTGDNYLSDDPDNEYITQIAKEYKISPDLLVAIYAVPNTGSNFVLEFNGERDAQGNVVKSPDTLKTVYNIGVDKSVKRTSGKRIGNVGMNYAEGMLCFGLVQEVVMPQYPDYFTGVQDRRHKG